MRQRSMYRRDDDLDADDIDGIQEYLRQKYVSRASDMEYEETTDVEQQALLPSVRDPKLFMVKCAGVVASGIAFSVQIWCIARGGPVFVAVYQPVQTLVVALMASVALGEEFYLGGSVTSID